MMKKLLLSLLISTTAALANDAHYASHAVTLGARISRFDLDVVQRGEGASARLDGLALIGGRSSALAHQAYEDVLQRALPGLQVPEFDSKLAQALQQHL